MDWDGARVLLATGAGSSTMNTSSTGRRTSTGASSKRVTEDKSISPTDLSNATTSLSIKKTKPIPPPLDLSIGAANLSLHHLNHHHSASSSIAGTTSASTSASVVATTATHHENCSPQQLPPPPCYQAQHLPYSPKFSQFDKNLPLRKRWHSWSFNMNGQGEGPMMVPLGFADAQMTVPRSSKASDPSSDSQSPLPHQTIPPPPYQSFSTSSTYARPGHETYASNGPNENSPSLTSVHSSSLQTPTPFYTPNEPSPKFMNSPVFSYTNPDTSLYQGPFSPLRASSLYPPSSPFTNLNLNSPLGPILTGSLGANSGLISSNGGMGNGCFNMIPSTLLSPAPSQASNNSLSFEDLQEKSLNFFTPAWSIFMAGTKVRFVHGMNSMDWYTVEFLAQSGDCLGLKGDYAPLGLEVRKFVVTSSAKERINVTFCPVGDPHQPAIEINCEPGHPFMVDKKGWCAVKPDVFLETYGTNCQTLECGDVCISLNSARSPIQYQTQQQQFQQQSIHIASSPSYVNGNHSLTTVKTESEVKVETDVDKVGPTSVGSYSQILNVPAGCRKLVHSLPTSAPASPAKKAKESVAVANETKGRRPMNAFLLFAKDKRPELIQMHPGKDNRAISCLLGEAWQLLTKDEKEKYSSTARARAEEQKRIHPDCWKRKRSQSTSSIDLPVPLTDAVQCLSKSTT